LEIPRCSQDTKSPEAEIRRRDRRREKAAPEGARLAAALGAALSDARRLLAALFLLLGLGGVLGHARLAAVGQIRRVLGEAGAHLAFALLDG